MEKYELIQTSRGEKVVILSAGPSRKMAECGKKRYILLVFRRLLNRSIKQNKYARRSIL